jgi:methionyl-tRNA formyltransferase
MRVIFMGTPAFALPTLQALLASVHEVVAVYTAPPRPAHRGKKVTISPVHELAEASGIPVFTPSSLKGQETQQVFAEHGADVAVVVAYGLLLPTPILTAYPYGCINIHPSSLPRWRGAAPIQRTIMAGDRDTSVCIMQMDAGLDTGAILMEESHLIDPNNTAQELEAILSQKAAPLLIQSLRGLDQHTLFPMPQLVEGVTYAAKISKEECALEFHRPAHELVCHIHGLSPFPGAYITYQGERIKIVRAEAVTTENIHPAGMVLDGQLTIQCGLHGVRPLTLQRAGKAAMPAEECLRGLSVTIGTVL